MVVTIKNYFHNVLFVECHVSTVWLTNCELCVTAECRKFYQFSLCMCTVRFHTENHSPQNIELNFQQWQKWLYVCQKAPHNLDLGECNDLYKDLHDGTIEKEKVRDDKLIRDGRHGN